MQPSLLDWQKVERRRAAGRIGRTVVYRESVGSTNTLAATLLPQQASPGTVIVADYQSEGRGRMQRRWLAAPGSALMCTVVLAPTLPQWCVPMIAGLAVVQALAAQGLPAVLKWPNDVLLRGRKCAGILVEGRRADSATYLLLGIGINVRDADPSLPDATYLDAHRSTPVRREDLLVDLLAALEHWCDRADEDAGSVRTAWRARLVTLGLPVSVRTPNERFGGLAIDIAEDGALVVRLPDGTERAVHAGDVTLAQDTPPRR